MVRGLRIMRLGIEFRGRKLFGFKADQDDQAKDCELDKAVFAVKMSSYN